MPTEIPVVSARKRKAQGQTQTDIVAMLSQTQQQSGNTFSKANTFRLRGRPAEERQR
jgi:hypothetical protein